MATTELKKKIINTLKNQGFLINPHIELTSNSKIAYKEVQFHARMEQLGIHKNFLLKESTKIHKYLINGRDIDPQKIDLELREIKQNENEEIIFKWWNLMWWSVPYQRPYGRQMRFLLWDKGHDAPFGLLGLQSPILKMSVRDNYLQIPKHELDIWINKSFQAQRLGALPPYNNLIGGKMVALAMTSNEVRASYHEKYKNQQTELLRRSIDPNLLFITTTSAFGKSSIYNRLKYQNEIVAQSLGYTKGAGSFHIPESLYTEITQFLKSEGINVSTTFGNGPSRKIKLLYTAFRLLKMPDYTYHNLQREFFLFPLVSNLKSVIHEQASPNYYNRPLNELVDHWKERWCLPRSIKYDDWKKFQGEDFMNKIINETFKGEGK